MMMMVLMMVVRVWVLMVVGMVVAWLASDVDFVAPWRHRRRYCLIGVVGVEEVEHR